MPGSAIASRLDRLSRPAKVGVVVVGYVAALALAIGAVAVHVALTSGPDRDASSGMHAFGDASLFVVAFGAAAAIPTAVALHLLRSHRGFWRLLSIAALGAPFSGDAYAGKGIPEVPKTLREATESLAASEFLKGALGADVVAHYVHTAKWEQFEYDRRITDWELMRGFERY